MRASPIINALNAGELSPALEGRTDLAKYPQSCKLIENFQLLVQGPAQRRGGSRYVMPIKSETTSGWLLRFEFSATQAFVLEIGNLYIRFFTNHGQLLVSGVAAYSGATTYAIGDLVVQGGINYYCIAVTTGNAPPNAAFWYPLTGSIYEIPSPYTLAALTNADGSCALDVEQSADVLYIAHASKTVKPYKLTRFANTNWRFAEYAPNQGPFLSENSNTALTIISSGTTGAVTLTASSALFAATDVGRLVRLQVKNLDVEPWEAGKAYLANALARFNGKTYKAVANATSGTSQPTHEQGTAFDGKGAVQWTYQESGYGIARITAFTDSTHVTATVITDAGSGLNLLPAALTTTATQRWRLGAWSATSGYPSSLAFFKNRLHWGLGIRFDATVPNDFENMAGDFFGLITIDAAISEQVQSQDVNDILWMEGLDKLIVGTGGGEFVVGPQTTQDAYGPSNISIDKQSKQRVRSVSPLVVGTALCYVQRAGRKLLSANYSIERDKIVSTDLAVLADRITRTGIIATAYQGEPHSIVWCVLTNGKLIGFTYDQDQEVTGWHRHPIGGGGFVESIATIPAPDGARDELWMLVRRTINGATRRYIEYFEKPWEGADQDGTPGDDQADAFYVDSGLTYSGPPTTTITGATHMIGATAQLLVDGAAHPDRVVDASGQVSLQIAGSKVQLGFGCPARIVPMRLEGGNPDGTAQGKLKRIAQLGIRFIDTLGGKIGLFGRDLDDISLRAPETPMNEGSPITSNDFVTDFPGDWDRDAFIEIRQDQPLPMTVGAIMPIMNTSPT